MNVSERQAPELRVQRWIGANGEKIAPLKLSDLGAGPKILFAFQDWCGGCHSHGFPTLQALHAVLSDQGVGFAVIQTVFEGAHENTFERLRPNQLEYELPVAFGHDEPPAGSTLPTFMQDYRTRGTPWFTVIDAGGRIYPLVLPPGCGSAREGAGAGLVNAAMARSGHHPPGGARARFWRRHLCPAYPDRTGSAGRKGT